MDEKEFQGAAAHTLNQLERALDDLVEAGAPIDFERVADGILEIEFDNGSKIIVNQHLPAREIWVAARSGGFHFAAVADGWRDTRSGDSLAEKLSSLISMQSDHPVCLKLSGD